MLKISPKNDSPSLESKFRSVTRFGAFTDLARKHLPREVPDSTNQPSLNLPRLTKTAYKNQEEKFSKMVEEVDEESTKKAATEIVEKNRSLIQFCKMWHICGRHMTA
ncbi:hypothetical protein TNCV_2062981 [Trichonephila clavipes]|nr:hypothetical protein TNCV_2062981 [Trichonephila clavipes]